MFWSIASADIFMLPLASGIISAISAGTIYRTEKLLSLAFHKQAQFLRFSA